MSTTGGYTTTKAKARKPRALKIGDIKAECHVDGLGDRIVIFRANEPVFLSRRGVARLQHWLAHAAAWCAEGGRR